MPVVPPEPSTLVTVPLAPVAAMVIEPLPFVMLIPDPAVNVALVSVLPVVLPISSWPLVYVVWPVPPLASATVPVTLAALPVMLPLTFEPARDVIHAGSA